MKATNIRLVFHLPRIQKAPGTFPEPLSFPAVEQEKLFY